MIVKIQNRRGGYTDYDPSKLLPGEFAVVQVGDPNTPTGKGVYLAISAGDVVRLATTEEIAAYTQQFDDIYQTTLQDAGVILDEAKLLISNYTGNLIVVDSISDMTDTSSLYLYNGSGEYKNYVYVYDPSQSQFVPLVNYGMFADLSGQVSQNTSNIATNAANITTNATNIATNTASINTNTTNIAANTTNIATNASNITENAINIAGLAAGVTNKIVKTTLSTTQIYANETATAYNNLSIPGLSDYMVVMVFVVCGNTRQRLVFVNGDASQQYMYTTEGDNKIRAGCYVDWEGERVRVRYLSLEGAYTYQNVYFADVVGFIKQGAIDGSGSGEFDPYQALYDAIIAYIDEHYTPSSSDNVPNEVKQAIYTLLSKAAYTETGLTDEIATVEEWGDTSTTRSVTNNLTNCTTSNSGTTVNRGSQYTATLTANTGYVLNTVTVSMGGVDITSTAYSSGTITISSVTGDIVITATAVAAVASLSAVYTQSGTVYDTAALSDLTADLVVTATYGDSSTAVIPSTDYTLSGTLTEGTSTITVAYGGKTATFNVTVTESTAAGLLYSWDFTRGLTDSVGGVTAILGGNATQTVNGITLSSASDYASANINLASYARRIEIDVTSYGYNNSGTHGRILTHSRVSTSQYDCGVIWRNTNKLSLYEGNWQDSSITDNNALTNSTISYSCYAAQGGTSVVALNGENICSISHSAFSNVANAICIGSSSGNSAYNLVVTAMRVYELN